MRPQGCFQRIPKSIGGPDEGVKSDCAALGSEHIQFPLVQVVLIYSICRRRSENRYHTSSQNSKMSSAGGAVNERMDVDTFMGLLKRIDEFILTMDQGPGEQDVTDMIEFRKIIDEIELTAKPPQMAGAFKVRMWDALKKHGNISKQHERDRLDSIQVTRVSQACQGELPSDRKMAIYHDVLREPTSGPVARGGAHYQLAEILKLKEKKQSLIHARAAVADFNSVTVETAIQFKNLPILLVIAAKLVAALVNGVCTECDGDHAWCVYSDPGTWLGESS